MAQKCIILGWLEVLCALVEYIRDRDVSLGAARLRVKKVYIDDVLTCRVVA